MIVLHKNDMYELDMPFLLFESRKLNHPDDEVKILQLTSSTYKAQKDVKLSEVEDWSIARNLHALSIQ